jgi:hypothetical protein
MSYKLNRRTGEVNSVQRQVLHVPSSLTSWGDHSLKFKHDIHVWSQKLHRILDCHCLLQLVGDHHAYTDPKSSVSYKLYVNLHELVLADRNHSLSSFYTDIIILVPCHTFMNHLANTYSWRSLTNLGASLQVRTVLG